MRIHPPIPTSLVGPLGNHYTRKLVRAPTAEMSCTGSVRSHGLTSLPRGMSFTSTSTTSGCPSLSRNSTLLGTSEINSQLLTSHSTCINYHGHHSITKTFCHYGKSSTVYIVFATYSKSERSFLKVPLRKLTSSNAGCKRWTHHSTASFSPTTLQPMYLIGIILSMSTVSSRQS